MIRVLHRSQVPRSGSVPSFAWALGVCLRLSVIVGLSFFAGAARAAPPPRTSTWALVFEDDFSGAALDTTKWGINYPWGQTHNHRAWVAPEQVTLSGGILKIEAEARRHPSAPSGVTQGGTWYSLDYTSGAIHTQGRLGFTHGYMEGRFRMPRAAGTWPAFWTLNSSGAWPPEIDILEVPHERNRFYYNYHYGADWQDHHSFGGDHWGPDLAGDFHVFGCEWDRDSIAFFLDDQEVRRFWDANSLAQAQDMYLLINLAVGGWAGDPPTDTAFPSSYEVDWVRVYKYRAGTDATWTLRGNGDWRTGTNWAGGIHPFVASDAARFLGLPSPASVRVDWSGLVALGHLEFAGATNMTLGTGDEKLLFARTSDAACTIVGTGAGRQSLYAQVELHQNLEVDWQASEPLTLQRALSGAGGLILRRGALYLNGPGSYTGSTLIEAGEFRVNSTTGLVSAVTVRGGVLGGSGRLAGDVVVESGGILDPGNVVGTLRAGKVSFRVGSRLRVDLRGTRKGSGHDALEASNVVLAAPVLETVLGAGYEPQVGDRYDVLDGVVTGAFSAYELPALAEGLAWDTSELRTEGVLSVASATPSFRRGDANADGTVDISDAILSLGYLFLGGEEPSCLDAVDSNDDGTPDISDAVSTLGFLFAGGAPPALPYPQCGLDATSDSLDCGAFAPCAAAP